MDPDASTSRSSPKALGRELFVFPIHLPFTLGLPHGLTVAMDLPGDLGPGWDVRGAMPGKDGAAVLRHLRTPFVSLKLWQYKTSVRPAELLAPTLAVADMIVPRPTTVRDAARELAPFEDYETVVEAVTQVPDGTDSRAVISEAFDRCLVAINRLVIAYARIARDASVHIVSRQMLDPVAPAIRRPIDKAPTEMTELFLTGGAHGAPSRPPVTPDQVPQIVHYLGLIARGHPLTDSTRFHLERSRAHAAGDFSSVLIWAAVGQEVVLNAILRLLLAEEGRAAEIQQAFQERGGLARRLNTQYAPRLGGTWNTRDGATAVGGWWNACQVIRGRVVHAGYVPTHADGDAAVAACVALDKFLGDRLAGKRFTYPRTAYTRLGIPGLVRRGAFSSRMKAVIAQVEPELEVFWGLATPA